MNNKKGISAIVATVLIILITVAAVTIIWAAIIPMITENLAGSSECFAASAALSVVSDYSCQNYSAPCNVATCGTANNEACTTKALCEAETAPVQGVWTPSYARVQVHRSTGDFVLVGVDVIVGSQGTTKVFGYNGTNIPDVNGEKLYTINLENFTTAPDEASVAAKVQAGNTQKTCDIGGTIKLPVCA